MYRKNYLFKYMLLGLVANVMFFFISGIIFFYKSSPWLRKGLSATL